MDDLVALSKQKPGTLNYLTASIPCVVYMDSLKRDKGADWVRVPFRGGGEAVTAVLGGSYADRHDRHRQCHGADQGRQDDGAGAGQQHPHAAACRDVPTWADLGYKGAASETWYGLFAPAGTPKAIIDKLNAEIVKVVSDPAFREKNIISRGLVPATGTPEDFAKTIKEGRVGAEQVVKESGLPPQ